MSKEPPREGSLVSCDPSELSFEFSHCAVFGGGPVIQWDGKKSELRWRDCYGDSWIPLASPTSLQWKAFLLLVEHSGAKEWEMSYSNPDIEDGIGWEFKFTAPGLNIQTTGNNAYPGSDSFKPLPGSPFDTLTTAIGILVGCEVHELKAPPHSGINTGLPPNVAVDSGDGEEDLLS